MLLQFFTVTCQGTFIRMMTISTLSAFLLVSLGLPAVSHAAAAVVEGTLIFQIYIHCFSLSKKSWVPSCVRKRMASLALIWVYMYHPIPHSPCSFSFTHTKDDTLTYGSVVKLQHVDSKYFLHSHQINWGSGSGQQSVTGH